MIQSIFHSLVIGLLIATVWGQNLGTLHNFTKDGKDFTILHIDHGRMDNDLSGIGEIVIQDELRNKKFSNGRGNDYYVYTRRGVVYKWAAGQELDLSFARSDPWMLVSKTKLDTPLEADQITGEEITRMGRVESFKPAEAQTYIPPPMAILT
ncbi:hypothetical protein Pst134EB_026195 [Puccinia striiformis f. sp. tritici]|nr:hypothetical protein Pst134EB_026195 [Puccinia striiformis f. sp. tritici]